MLNRDILASDDPQESDLAGRTLGDYRLLRRLGSGAMAQVYLAEQASLRRRVAFKVLKAELAAQPTYVKRFRLEAQAAASLVHPHIVQIYEVGCIDGVHFIAQEFVAGRNVQEALHAEGIPSVPQVLRILRAVAGALQKAAEAGVVHRDIKPENILISHAGEVKVTDFGLARIVGEGAGLNLTQAGFTLGTPLYMSPEQAEGRPLDPRSDIYSLGVTAYQLLCGEPPFTGDNPLAVAVQHIQRQPEPLERRRPELPPALCELVSRMLAKRPEERFASARELGEALRRLSDEDASADGPLTWGVQAESVEGTRGAWSVDDVARTQALDALTAVMRATPLRVAGRAWWGALAAGLLVAFLGGMAATWVGRSPNLLAGADPRRTHVERRPTVLGQWIYAMQDGSEASWLAIEEHFPQERYFILRAKQQLARMYLFQDRVDDARALFDELADAEEALSEFRAFGMAGQSIVLSLVGEHQASQRKLNELLPLREHLLGTGMIEPLLRSARANRQALRQQEADEAERWLADRFGAEED